jgi:hypothetical protein
LSLHNNAANPFLGVCIKHETRFRQVFWLTGSAYLLCLPVPIRTVASIKAFIPGYSGGSAPDFHGIPFILNAGALNINVFPISQVFFCGGSLPLTPAAFGVLRYPLCDDYGHCQPVIHRPQSPTVSYKVYTMEFYYSIITIQRGSFDVPSFAWALREVRAFAVKRRTSPSLPLEGVAEDAEGG